MMMQDAKKVCPQLVCVHVQVLGALLLQSTLFVRTLDNPSHSQSNPCIPGDWSGQCSQVDVAMY
jgi:hypothetical protein